MLWSNWDVFSGRTTFTTKFLDQDFGSAYCLAGISIYHELPGDRLNGLCSRVQAFRLWFAWLCHPLVWYLKRLRSWPTVRNNWVENQGRSRLSCQSLHGHLKRKDGKWYFKILEGVCILLHLKDKARKMQNKSMIHFRIPFFVFFGGRDGWFFF